MDSTVNYAKDSETLLRSFESPQKKKEATHQESNGSDSASTRHVKASPVRSFSQNVEVNDYQLGDCLGKGAFGSVFRALNMSTGETVAVKQIRLADLPKSELRVITLEIDLLKNLDHPNIVRYEGFFKSAESLNIILEYCENGSLHSISKNFGKFPENLVGIYMSQVLHGLLYLHEQGVIHRDIKGANILLTKQGLVKLADFGVATRTATFNESTVVGTPYWMAPEVIELSGATTSSDIWSLGCTVIELLDGKPPYHKLQPMHALFRIVNDDHPPLPEGASPIVRDFLMQCFQKDPNLRVSARKLLRHPWIVNAKRSNNEVPDKPTEYTQAVKKVREWNEALKSPTSRSTHRPRTRTPSHAGKTSETRPAHKHKPASAKQISQSLQQRELTLPDHQNGNPEKWDADFEGTNNDGFLRQSGQTPKASSLKLASAQYSSNFAIAQDHDGGKFHRANDDRAFIPETSNPRDPHETIRPTQRKIKVETGIRDRAEQLKANDVPCIGASLLSELGQPTIEQNAPLRSSANTDRFVETGEEDYSDIIVDDVFLQKHHNPHSASSQASPKLYHPSSLNLALPVRSRPNASLVLYDAPIAHPSLSPIIPDGSVTEIERFAEDEHDEDFSDVFGKVEDYPNNSGSNNTPISRRETLLLGSRLSHYSWQGPDDDEDDPFAQLEEGFDEVDLEANVARDRHARLCTQVESLVGELKTTQAEGLLASISEQLLFTIAELPEAKSFIISAHGMLPILEILESCRHRDVTLKLLKIVNTIISGDIECQENFCFVGGIPIITRFASKRFPSEIRLEAAAFTRQMFQTSALTLQMFVSAGGLKVLVEFLEEDFDDERDLVLIGVTGIWSVFELQGPTPKNDFCRILSRNSVLDPLSLVLSRILDEEGDIAEHCEGRIAKIFFIFSQAENHVKEIIAERTILHRVLKELRRMSAPHQITMLKFIKNLSMLSTTLDALQNSNAIDVLIDLLKSSVTEVHYREISNQILNTIYNLCRLNKSRQEDAALNGIIPVLQQIIKTKGPLKEFALPIICDMAASGKVGRRELWRNKGLAFYISLLEDEFWQVTALDTIFIWLQEETAKVEEHLLRGPFAAGIVRCFVTAKANAFENILEPLQKLLGLSQPIARCLANDSLFHRILQKLSSNKAVTRLNLLRIVRSICDASEDRGTLLSRYGLEAAIKELSETDGAVLVRNMASELVKFDSSCMNRSIHDSNTPGGQESPVISSRPRSPPRHARTSSAKTQTRHQKTVWSGIAGKGHQTSAAGTLVQTLSHDDKTALGGVNGRSIPVARSRLPRTSSTRKIATSVIAPKTEAAVHSPREHSNRPQWQSRSGRKVSGDGR